MITRALNAYWFKPAPLVNLAMCRIIIVGYQLAHMLRMPPREHYLGLSQMPDALYDPLPIFHMLIWPWGWNYRPSYDLVVTFHWATAVAGACALVGLATNVSLFAFS